MRVDQKVCLHGTPAALPCGRVHMVRLLVVVRLGGVVVVVPAPRGLHTRLRLISIHGIGGSYEPLVFVQTAVFAQMITAMPSD